jgi:hypothetical protein
VPAPVFKTTALGSAKHSPPAVAQATKTPKSPFKPIPAAEPLDSLPLNNSTN